MRSWIPALFLFFAMVLGDTAAIACQTPSDCEPGTHCEIPDERLTGVCVSDIAQPPIGEQETVETPTIDDDSAAGNECVSSDECGVGGRCVKQPGAISGVCSGGM